LKESITTQTASPAALSTCHESREVAFARYETLTIEGVHTGAMINWSLDTLFVNASTISQRMADRLNDAVIQSKCRRLALGREFFYGFTFTKDSVLQSLPSVFLRKFKRIEELIVVMEEEEPSVVDFLENGRLLKSMRRDGGEFIFSAISLRS
jgi:hypothetical protein